MNPEIKEKWVKALRSGEYKQCMNVLKKEKDNSFCCLGVLTDLYIKEKGLKWSKEGNLNPNCMVLPKEVVVWSELRSSNPNVPCPFREIQVHLGIASFNDGDSFYKIKRHNFNEIADLIEANL